MALCVGITRIIARLTRTFRLPALLTVVLLISACLATLLFQTNTNLKVKVRFSDGHETKYFTNNSQHNLKAREGNVDIPADRTQSQNEKLQNKLNGGLKKLQGNYQFQMRSSSNHTRFITTHPISKQCQNKNYGSLDGWPTASVIITFCNNENLADVLHTIHSVMQRSPPQLLKEIIMIDDNTSKDDFKDTFNNYCASMFGSKLRTLRSTESLGLIKARLLGARTAQGDVFVMLDAHMEVQEKWLEAILLAIKNERRIMATLSMDWMKPEASGYWNYEYGPGSYVCVFGWDLGFGYSYPRWKDIRVYEDIDETIPVPTPCSVGNWAMDKKFFLEIGELDDGMEKWGGENIDVAVRSWLFGGRAVQIPCSHAAHMERPDQRAYRGGWEKYINANYRRVIEVWFDEYKRYVYEVMPHIKGVEMGNITTRLELKKRASHNFTWYLNNVFPALGIYDKDSFGYKNLRNLKTDKCAKFVHNNWKLRTGDCSDMFWVLFLSADWQLRMGPYMFQADMLHKEAILLGAIAELERDNQLRWLHWKDGPVKVLGHDTCLQYADNTATLKPCDRCRLDQRWSWETYSPQYEAMIHNNTVHGPDWRVQGHAELRKLMAEWPKPTRNESNPANPIYLC